MKKVSVVSLAMGIFFIVGLFFLIIGVFVCINTFDYSNTTVTKGVITDIKSYRRSNDTSDYEVHIKYNVDGKEYNSTYSGYSSSFYVGKELDLYYKNTDITKIGIKSLDLLMLIFPGLGLIFSIIGGCGLFASFASKKKAAKLKEEGVLVHAKYLETVQNTFITINGRHPFNILCEARSPFDGEKYVFKSRNLDYNPENIIMQTNINTFPVYIKKDNIKSYIVDVDILENVSTN